MWLWLASSVLLASQAIATPSLGSAATQFLDGEAWEVAGGNIRCAGSVPGDLITDLQRAGIIGDPLYELNFLSPVWDRSNFSYSTTFVLASDVVGQQQLLLSLDGVKMVADVTLNNHSLGYIDNAFLRFVYPVTSLVHRNGQSNTLTVTFTTSNDTRNKPGRWPACSGGWDWAPVSNTAVSPGDPFGDLATFSKGIWRSVFIAGTGQAFIDHVVPQVFYVGEYPSEPLFDDRHGDFVVRVTVALRTVASTGASGKLFAHGNWGATNFVPVHLEGGVSSADVTLNLTASHDSVKLWWPNGLGEQTMYNLNVTFVPSDGGPAITVVRRLGFRVFALVSANDTDVDALRGQDGSGNFTMRFKVNGADVWSRGANMVPMDEMEGRLSDAAHTQLVRSAAAAGMNTLRL